MQEPRSMDQRSWQWLRAVCLVFGTILVFVAALNRNTALAVTFAALTLGGLFFVSRGYQKHVREYGEKPLSTSRRAWGIRFNVFALIYCVVVGTIAAVTGHTWLVLSALSTAGICGYQLLRLSRTNRPAS